MSARPDKLDFALADACVMLGLLPPFSSDQAKSRYRELAKLYHPDVGVAKDSVRFAHITQAYDLVTENAQRLSNQKISLVSEHHASSTQIADVLEQLRQARTANLQSDKKVQQLEAEAASLRAHLQANRTFTAKRVVGVTLLIAVGIVLGFLAGMLWSAQPPIVPFIPPHAQQIRSETTQTQFIKPLPWAGYNAEITLDGPTSVSLTYSTGTVSLGRTGATLDAPLNIIPIQFPEVSIQVIPPTPVAAPAPTPTPIPAVPETAPSPLVAPDTAPDDPATTASEAIPTS